VTALDALLARAVPPAQAVALALVARTKYHLRTASFCPPFSQFTAVNQTYRSVCLLGDPVKFRRGLVGQIARAEGKVVSQWVTPLGFPM